MIYLFSASLGVEARRDPVAGDVDAAGDPDAIVLHHVVVLAV